MEVDIECIKITIENPSSETTSTVVIEEVTYCQYSGRFHLCINLYYLNIPYYIYILVKYCGKKKFKI